VAFGSAATAGGLDRFGERLARSRSGSHRRDHGFGGVLGVVARGASSPAGRRAVAPRLRGLAVIAGSGAEVVLAGRQQCGGSEPRRDRACGDGLSLRVTRSSASPDRARSRAARWSRRTRDLRGARFANRCAQAQLVMAAHDLGADCARAASSCAAAFLPRRGGRSLSRRARPRQSHSGHRHGDARLPTGVGAAGR